MASLKQSIVKNRPRAHQPIGPRGTAKADAVAPAVVSPQPQKEPSAAMLERGIDLLEQLAKHGPAAAADLARLADCAPLTATRLLKILQAKGFAVCDDTAKTWSLGTRWNAFGKAAVEQGALATTATPFLTALGLAAGENAYLRIRNGMESETIAVCRTDPMLRIYSEVGNRGPLHAGTSRMLLAHAPEAVQTQLLTQRLPRFTPATRTDPNWIAADLQRIRARGYLVTADEVVPGAVSVGAPVRDASGEVVAVIFISAPTMRMRPPRPRALVSIVQDAAAKLSHALGYTRSETMITAAPVPRKPGAPSWAMPSSAAIQGRAPASATATRPSV